MTLPASGAIAISDFNTLLGNASGTALAISTIQSLGKSGSYSLNAYYGMNYFQSNALGNCNNGNCATATSNCYQNCTNCSPLATVNCANCDTKAYIQANCNCACTCNCSQVANQLVDCAPVTGTSSCFPAGSLTLMADGTWKAVETIEAGEYVMGADGAPALVIEAYQDTLGARKMFMFEEDGHTWSDEHIYWVFKDGKEWWWAINPDQWRWEASSGHVKGLKDIYSIFGGTDCLFAHLNGFVARTPKRVDYPSDTKVYMAKTAGIPTIVNGYVVTGGTDEDSYDYNAFKWVPCKVSFRERAE